jgi:XRE family transcriptional regulator, fatty acid utilization regulator
LPSEENIKLIFGIKLKHLRQKRKLNPLQLSEKSGISNSYLNEIEKGRKYPKTDKINALAEALQVKYDDLVSLKLPKEFAAFELLLQSNILSELPLNMLGFDINSIVDLLSNSPTKINAFLNTIVEIARNHDLQTEYFYFSVLRSYQEIKENYFEDTELDVINFIKQQKIDTKEGFTSKAIKEILARDYQYTFNVLPVKFKQFRSIYKLKENCLYLNENLNEHQLLFVLGREIAFNFLNLEPRPLITTHFNDSGFSEIFNNFIASYFATALLLPQDRLVKDLNDFFKLKTWDNSKFEEMIDSYGVSAEMYMHRLTNLLPKFFKLNSLFFLRLSKPQDRSVYNISKELHLGRLHNPHASSKDLHYCRRWISLQILNDLEALKDNRELKDVSLIKAQISNYIDSKDAYFIISVARPMYPVSGYSTSVSVGILMNDSFKKIIAFAKDDAIPNRMVSEACETCRIMDCKERAVPAALHNKEQRLKLLNENLKNFNIN